MFKTNSSICTPRGLECFENITTDEKNCRIPCQGLYADITHIKDMDHLDNTKYFGTMRREYELFKRGNFAEVDFPNELECKHSCMVLSLCL